jgi:hypothetical protein
VSMDSKTAYEQYRETVKKEAAKITRPLEISQGALWQKAIVVEAMAGKHGDCKLVGAGDTFGFSEQLVNQCIEFAMQYVRAGRTDEEWRREEFERGYNTARREFAKATGLYTDEDMDDGRY